MKLRGKENQSEKNQFVKPKSMALTLSSSNCPTVVNLFLYILTSEQYSLLSKGLHFAVVLKRIHQQDIISFVNSSIRMLSKVEADVILFETIISFCVKQKHHFVTFLKRYAWL